MHLSVSLQGSASPEDHASYVWQHIIEKSVAKEVYIVAHSYGGIVTVHLVHSFIDVPMYTCIPHSHHLIVGRCTSIPWGLSQASQEDSIHWLHSQICLAAHKLQYQEMDGYRECLTRHSLSLVTTPFTSTAFKELGILWRPSRHCAGHTQRRGPESFSWYYSLRDCTVAQMRYTFTCNV